MMFGGFGMGLGMLLIVGLPLVLLFGGGAYFVRVLRHQDIGHGEVQDTPSQILDARLASGKIGLEEYDTLRRRLDISGGKS